MIKLTINIEAESKQPIRSAINEIMDRLDDGYTHTVNKQEGCKFNFTVQTLDKEKLDGKA